MNKLLRLSLVLSLFSLNACAHSENHQESGPKILEFTSDGSGFDTKTYFYIGEDGVAVLDAQFTPEIAQKALAQLRRVTNKPILYVIVTHPNPDKFNGAAVFQRHGGKVIASDATLRAIPGVHAYKKTFFVGAKMFTDESYPAMVKIDESFTGELELRLGSKDRILLRELSSPGVSSTQTVAFVPEEKALFVGDLVHHKVHAWLEGGIVNGKAKPDLSGWKADLREIAVLYPGSRVYGGRGQSGPIEKVVNEQIQYLDQARKLVSDYASEIKRQGSKPDFIDLQKRFETARPDYGLSYLIQYGVYGLFQSVP